MAYALRFLKTAGPQADKRQVENPVSKEDGGVDGRCLADRLYGAPMESNFRFGSLPWHSRRKMNRELVEALSTEQVIMWGVIAMLAGNYDIKAKEFSWE